MKKTNDIFKKNPEKHDFPAAQDYLELIYDEQKTVELIKKLTAAKTIYKKCKDVFRASELPLLPRENKYVQEDLQKVKKGIKLSPILLVRGNNKLIIADGYHRMCASYLLNEDLELPCRLI
ncbi:hypothetical protein M2347_002405 [Chryseobacterium sp. H1D6B]|uniref:hypothetical protein n=1 Tax=Chryseobacterium sp. H1D6B TaxID=2940588 RepID=UPI0015CE6B70|nr:hypothetical protein [Chryseobacterium sp. H1D6B]MDH6252678.1 hypothetical protein [Chryseobacterium sp. H1D6B]